MKVYNKIGFHLGPGGNPTGIGDWMRALDNAGIPFFIKSVDGYGPCYEAGQIAEQSGVPHTLVFRLSTRGQNDGYDYDVPPYKDPKFVNDPEGGAEKHWQRTRASLPPEFDKSRAWIEPINEVDKNLCDWLGRFAVRIANLAQQDGYKVSLFAWSSGEPEPEGWETPGMLAYLRLCATRPDQAAVALHEYSFVVDNIDDGRPYKIGRFQALFDICDKHKIPRPTIHITEWGWAHNNVPDPQRAVKDIRNVGELYARFPQIKGAAIWYLGAGYEGIANKTQRFIKPVADFTLTNTFDVDVEEGPVALDTRPPMSTTPVGPPTDTPTPNPNVRFIRDVAIPDDSRLPAGKRFTKKWRVENSGNVAWGPGYKLVHTDGEAMTNVTGHDVPAVEPGQKATISLTLTAPATPGVHFSDWRMVDGQSNPFGDILYTRIVSVAPPPSTTGVSDGRFVDDITIPDDMEMAAGNSFTKTWRVRNAGTRTWGDGFTLEFAGGVPMTNATSFPLAAAAPGDTVNISIAMIAPTTPGTHYGDWRMKDDQGNYFGEVLYVRIVVPWQEGSSWIKPMSQRDPLWANMRLGHAGSPQTIGRWGCLVACYAMVANAFGHDVTPAQLNNAMIQKGGFVNLYVTKWKALSDVYDDIVYEGRLGANAPDLITRIDASLAARRPVSVQVDFTSDTPYTDNDQHWVLIVGKDGDDYRINDPWLLPAQEASLRQRYGRAGRPLRDAIMAATFYRSTGPVAIPEAPEIPLEGVPTRLQTGMNVNPDARFSNPVNTDDLKGLDWARFVFKLDARAVAERGNWQKAFAQYDPIVRKYNQMGVNSLIIINQETIWGQAPWTGNNDWNGYAGRLAAAARRIARRYRGYGDKVAYEIWNEGDKSNNPASVYVRPENFAIILKKTAAAIRAESPDSPIISGGLATGPEEGIAYLNKCQAALNGTWPVDAIGIHPYTRWATRAPFDWGQQYGTLGDAFAQYGKAFPGMPFWITEIGVAADNEIGSQYYREIADYLKDVYKHVADRYARLVPVVIWFAWSDRMRNAGIVDRNGRRKQHVYLAFRAVRNREL